MKKVIASAGLVAFGVTALQAQYAPGLSRIETTKPWSVSASLRGFYDDNYFAQPNAFAEESYGFEVRPRIAFNLPREQTYIGGAYTYGLKYYEARDDDPIDQTHEVDLKLDHRFTERMKGFENAVGGCQHVAVVAMGVHPRTLRCGRPGAGWR